MKRKDDARLAVSNTRAMSKNTETPLRPSDLPSRDKKRSINLIDLPLKDTIPKKARSNLAQGPRSQIPDKGAVPRRSTSQATCFRQVKAWLGEASSKELDTLRNLLLKVRPVAVGDRQSTKPTDNIRGQDGDIQNKGQGRDSVCMEPCRDEQRKKAEKDNSSSVFPDLQESARMQRSEGHNDYQQISTVPETPSFLEGFQKPRPGTGSLHEKLMKLARERHGAV